MADATQASAGSTRGADVLAIGFGTTVAMWAVAYFSLMQPGLVVGELLFGVMLLLPLLGGLAAARLAQRGVVAGAMVGFVCGALNLLLIGSLIGGEKPGEWATNALLWAVGTVAAPTIIAAIGAAIGGSMSASRAKALNWPVVFIFVAATATLLLITTGGLVTTLMAGMAFPDWPTSFGHNMLLYPLSKMSVADGKYFEHAHRLYGLLVGVTGITLAIAMFLWESRGSVRVLGVVILLMICVQGLMGGFRVTENSIPLAIVHGVNGQIILALTVGLAMMVTLTWKTAPMHTAASAALDRGLSLALLGAVLLQIMLGAMYRHLQAADEPSMGMLMGLRHGHAFLGSTLVVVLSLTVSMRGVSVNNDVLPVKRASKAVLHTMILQALLGVATFLVVPSEPRPAEEAVPLAETILATAHQAIGAVLLAAAMANALWTWRMLRKPF